MATHEAVAGLGASFDLVDLGVPVSATLAASSQLTGAPIQVLELTANLGFRSSLIGQGGDQNLQVVAMLAGELAEIDGRDTHTQPYLVSGLAAPAIPEDQLFQGRQAPGVPLRGAGHPTIADVTVIDRRSRFQVAGEARADWSRVVVDVTWGRPLGSDLTAGGGASGMGVLSLAPSTFAETIWTDKDNDIMRITYALPIVGTASRVVSADIQRQTWTATLTKDFSAPQYADMLRASFINSAAFGVFGARTLLFLGPTINETDEGQYTHGYQMTFNPDGWKLRSSIWLSGFIPFDASENFNPPLERGGLGLFNIYDEFDFADLPVAFP